MNTVKVKAASWGESREVIHHTTARGDRNGDLTPFPRVLG